MWYYIHKCVASFYKLYSSSSNSPRALPSSLNHHTYFGPVLTSSGNYIKKLN